MISETKSQHQNWIWKNPHTKWFWFKSDSQNGAQYTIWTDLVLEFWAFLSRSQISSYQKKWVSTRAGDHRLPLASNTLSLTQLKVIKKNTTRIHQINLSSVNPDHCSFKILQTEVLSIFYGSDFPNLNAPLGVFYPRCKNCERNDLRVPRNDPQVTDFNRFQGEV